MFFQNSIAGTINGKNYLFCNVINGPSAKQSSYNLTFVILDITNPYNPLEISSLQTGQEAHPLALALKLYGTTLYIVTNNNLWIINVSESKSAKRSRANSVSWGLYPDIGQKRLCFVLQSNKWFSN